MNSGVYILYNIFTGRKYIGSSRNLRHRKISHFSGLRNGTHENYKVQMEWDTYGMDGFRWEILEHCPEDKLVEREQWWLDSLKPELNILLTADNHTCRETTLRQEGRRKQAERLRGRRASDETRKKMSQSHLLHWSDPVNREKLKRTPEQRAHLSKINTGENNPNWGKTRSQETKNKARKSLSKLVYIFLSPQGGEIRFEGGLEFSCKQFGLPYGAARNLYRGLTETHNGWRFVRTETHPTSKEENWVEFMGGKSNKNSEKGN